MPRLTCEARSLSLDHIGLNRLARERAAYVDGVDRAPELLKDAAEQVSPCHCPFWSDCARYRRNTVAVACGAAINSVGRAAPASHRTARFPAARTRTGPATALGEAVAGHYGVGTVAEVVTGIRLKTISRKILDDLSALWFAVAASGDEVARRAVGQRAKEVVALATVAADRLVLGDSRLSVVLGGGVRTRHPLLHDSVNDGIVAHSPAVIISVLTRPPIVGAGLFPLDALGAAPRSHSALRHFAPVFNQVSAAL